MMGLKAGQFDIETAFLYGDLAEELWMILPDGYDMFYHAKHGKYLDGTRQCLKLKKSLYGLVQAARQWWKKFKDVMKDIGYLPSDIDPNQKSFVIIYVDDGGIFGTDEDIKETIEA